MSLTRRTIASLAVASLAAGQILTLFGGVASASASATSSTPTVTFGTTSVSGFTARITYSVNRVPHQIAAVACSLTKSGVTTGASCGSQTNSSATSTTYGVSLGGLHAGTYTYRATVRLTDGGGGANSTSFTIRTVAANCTVAPYAVTYDGYAHTASGSCTGTNGVNVSADLNVTGTTHTNAGSYSHDSWSFTDPNGDYTNPGGQVSDSIGKASALCSVSAYSTTYDGTAHTDTGSCTGVGSVDLSSDLNLSGTTHTNAGNYPADGWSFADPTGNYKSASGTVSDSIATGTANCTVTAYSTPYDGKSHTATGSCTGAGGVSLNADLNITGTTHTNAGSYGSDSWSFTDPTGNYKNLVGTVSDSIAAATPDCTVNVYSVTYDGSLHTATGSCTGLNGVSFASGDLDLSHTSHTSAGSYPTDTWSFADPSGNYTSTQGTVTDTINAAAASCSISTYGITYDGKAHTATGSCVGPYDVALPSSDLDLSATTHTSVGVYHDTWSFSDPNYTNPGGTATDTIGKSAADCSVSSYAVNYDGSAHTATGSCTGLGGAALPLSDLDFVATSHTNAGQYTDLWSFNDLNYYNSGGSVGDQIIQVSATCTVTGYNDAYTSYAQTATGTCTGVGGVDLSSDLDLSGTSHAAVGTYPTDSWTFTDPNGNYAAQNDTVSDTITLAPVNCFAQGYTVTYDGQPHTASVSCVGAGNGAVLPSNEIDISSTTHTEAGTHLTDAWSFTDTTGDYMNDSGTVADTINPATATCSVTGYNVNWDNQVHEAAGSCTGVGGTTLPSWELDLGFTNHSAVRTYSDPWTFADPDYALSGGTVTDIITTSVVCTVTGYNVTFDGNAHTASGSCSSNGTDLHTDLQLNGTLHTNAGTYTDTWTFHDPTGTYPDQTGTAGDTIGRANATCTVAPYNATYDGTTHYATGRCTDVNGVDLPLNGSLDFSQTAHVNVGTYPNDSWSFNTGNAFPNYNEIDGVVITDTIVAGGGTNCIGTCHALF